ncbi:MAG: YihY/virulence factor BrkB family protein [Erythrobacter sp.]
MDTPFLTKAMPVVQRTAVRTWDDGFIHAGNLAYLSMLAIFPFFILGAALFPLFGSAAFQTAMIDTVLTATTPTVREIVGPVARSTVEADTGWLIWVGAAAGLWTLSSLIESIRDIMRRAYDTRLAYPYWQSRLFSIAVILVAVLLMMVSLFAQVAIGTAQQAIASWSPQLLDSLEGLQLSRIVPALGLFISLYLVFLTLTPSAYRVRAYPKWPGALATTLWWLFVTTVMPMVVSQVVTYNLIYGSLAGIMLVLFFFWLVGLGLVMGAELNASLADALAAKDTDEETDG